MGIREQINQKPALTTAVVAGLVVLIVLFLFWQLTGGKPPSHSGVDAYFTSDDGKTWFADDIDIFPPFEHGGTPAVRCYVFKCGSSAPFAGYLEKLTPAMHDQLTGVGPKGPPAIPTTGTLVKKPAASDWVLEVSPQGQKIVDVHCPDGSSEIPQPVMP